MCLLVPAKGEERGSGGRSGCDREEEYHMALWTFAFTCM